MKINYLDLFSGVGGFTRGLLDAGFTFGWHGFSEIDKHAVKLYHGLYPTAEAMGDITNISTDELRGLSARIGGINLITFGFPCQDLSIAGNRKGLEGKRSGLFFEALRIIKAVRPDCFIFENVKGLFSSKNGADFKAVLQAVADIGLYDCQWQLLNTRWFLPQNRERIYFVGLLRGQRKFRREIFPVGEDVSGTTERTAETAVARTLTAGGHSGGHHSGMTLLSSTLQGSNCLKTIRTGGRGSLTSKHSWDMISVGTWRTHKDGEGFREMQTGDCPTLPARARQDGSGQPVIAVLTPDRPEKRQNGRRFKAEGEPMFTLTGQDKHGIGIGQRIRRLTPLECFRLQFGMKNAAVMIAKANELNISDTQLYKQAGNAVSSPVVQCIAERLLQVEG